MSLVLVIREIPAPVVGSCGEVHDRRVDTLEADLDWLEVSGVPVERVEPTRHPEALRRSPDADRAWHNEGRAALPMVIVGHRLVSQGVFPSRHQLAHLVAEQRRVHAADAVRRLATLAVAAAVGTARDLERQRALAKDVDIDPDDIELAVEAGRQAAHDFHVHPTS